MNSFSTEIMYSFSSGSMYRNSVEVSSVGSATWVPPSTLTISTSFMRTGISISRMIVLSSTSRAWPMLKS